MKETTQNSLEETKTTQNDPTHTPTPKKGKKALKNALKTATPTPEPTPTAENPATPEPKKKTKKKKVPVVHEVEAQNIHEVDLSALKKRELLTVAKKLQEEKTKNERRDSVMSTHGIMLANAANTVVFSVGGKLAERRGVMVPSFESIEAQEQLLLNTALVEVLKEYLPDVETSPLGVYCGMLALTMMKHGKRINEQTEEEDQRSNPSPGETGNRENNGITQKDRIVST